MAADHTAMALSMNRLKELCQEWSRLSNTPSEVAALDGLVAQDDKTTPINALLVACAGPTVNAANQRGMALLHFLLKPQVAPTNVALVLSRPSASSPITEYTATFLSVGPIDSSNEGVTGLAAGVTDVSTVCPKVVMNRCAAAVTEADSVKLFAAVVGVAAAAPVAVAVLENEFKFHADAAPAFVGAIEAYAKNQLVAATPNLRLTKAQKFFTALLVPKYDNEGSLCIRRGSAMYSAVFKTFVTPALDAVASGASMNLTVGDVINSSRNFLNAANTMPGYDVLKDWRAFGAVLEPGVYVNNKYSPSLATSVTPEEEAKIISPKDGPVVVRLSARNREQCVLGARTYFFKDACPSNAEAALAFAAAAESFMWATLNAAAAANAANATTGSAVLLTTADVASQIIAGLKTLPGGDVFAQYVLTSELGGVIGPVITERRSALLPQPEVATLPIRASTSYFVRVVLKDIVDTATNTTYSVEIGDSIIVGMADDFAKRAPRTFPDVLLLSDSDPARGMADAAAAAAGGDARRTITTRGQMYGNNNMSAEEQRVAKQAKLWDEKEREFGSSGPKPKAEDPANELSTIGRIANGTLQSYPNRPAAAAAAPAVTDKLFANAAALSVWLPIGGKTVPFHMSTIKEVTIRPDGAAGYVCNVVFHTVQESNLAFRTNRSKIFVRELSYRAAESAMFDAVRNGVIIGHENIKDTDKKRQSEKGLLPSSGLGVRTGTVVARLPNVALRPQVYAKIANRGTLEATDRGFRFDFTGGGLTAIEIPYDNVHYCICQPASNDIQVLFHIALYKPIQWGKEKLGVKEFQVAAVVLEASEGVNGRRKMTEAEELEQEENERRRVAATNKEFIDFSKLVSSKIKNIFVPNKSFDIDGSMGKGNVRIRGSNKALWQITETPFQSVIFSDIEIAILERMLVGGKTFDLVLVPKNYKNKLVTISSIPMKKADEVKTWLCGGDLVFIEIGTNQNYPRLFKQFEADPEWNPWDRQGWRAMVDGGSDEEGDEDAESSSDDSWGGSSDEDGSDDDSDASDLSDDDEASDDLGDSSSDDTAPRKKGGRRGRDDSDSDESSADWSDMARRAEEEDEEDDSGSEDERPARKMTRVQPGGAGRGGPGGARGVPPGRGAPLRR